MKFAPGARTAWHHHPKGQTLYVTDGIRYVARRGGEVQEIRPGDVVYIQPGEEHRHGATHDRFMAHIAIQEADENGTSSPARGRHRRRPPKLTPASDRARPSSTRSSRSLTTNLATLADHLRQAADAGDIAPLTDAEIQIETRLLTAALDGMGLQWLRDPTTDLIATVSTYVERAIAA
uniref:cupin domain-containing protein n=1 Tax=Actinotalea ferrariae TaxID=1386098 RepID=UPI0027E0F3B4|nr:cupin domain-containing protein [Actinotalea ferrariae]